MASPDPSLIGSVISADIAVPEHDRESRFYSSVLTTGESPLWREDLMSSDGVPVIGLGELTPAYGDLPLQWMPHMQVADVAASADRALANGAREVMHHKDEEGQSQWAVFTDPNGAAFGIIPVVPADAIPPVAGGRIAWLDLTVGDAPGTRDFYQEVVGWSATDVEMGDDAGQYADYALCRPDGTAVAGVCHARGINQGLPPVWLICLPVGDLAESLARVEKGGGEVLDVRKNAEGEHTYAAIRDPVGVCFSMVPG